MDKIITSLNKLGPISLKEMDSVKLLNRTDTKYVVNKNILPVILNDIKDKYFVLEIDKQRLFSYESLYFDTEGLFMFTAHHNGKLNRYKIRKREYIESKLNYLEIKFKNNKGRTIKKRICGDDLSDNLSDRAKGFIAENTPFKPEGLKGQVTTAFKRFTLVNKNLTERITVDLNVSFKNHLKNAKFNNISIIEVKQDKLTNDSLLTEKLRENKIQPGSFSKYCFGTVLTGNNIKTNNFKPKLLQINKIEYAN